MAVSGENQTCEARAGAADTPLPRLSSSGRRSGGLSSCAGASSHARQGGGKATHVQESEFALRYLPFWITNYALAVVFWSLIGRFLLGFFVPQLQPGNYIWRAFYWLTEWSVWLVRWITPMAVRPFLMPLVAGFWVFHLRVLLFFIFAGFGMVPKLTGS